MLYTPNNDFLKTFSNQTTPSLTPGTSITPGINTFPAYVEILSDTVVTEDCYGILITISNNSASGNARDTLLNIGRDPSGGTSFTTFISNLLCTDAANSGVGYIRYYFPIWIKSGTALAAQASVNNGTVATLRVWVTLFAAPTHPELMRVGSYVTAIGAVTGTSRGTTVTPGTSGAEGTYVSLGTPSVPHWWWQCGMGISDGSMSVGVQFADIAAGDGTNKILLLENIPFATNAAEVVAGVLTMAGCSKELAASIEIWGRLSNSLATNDGGYSLAAYGLGG